MNEPMLTLDLSNLGTDQNSPAVIPEYNETIRYHKIPVHLQFDTILLLNGIKFKTSKWAIIQKQYLCMFLMLHAKLKDDGKIIFVPENKRQRDLAVEKSKPFFTCTMVDGACVFSPKKYKKIVGLYAPWLSTPSLMFGSLISYFLKKGYIVRCFSGRFKSKNHTEFLEGCQHLFMWNCYLWSTKCLRELCNSIGIKCSFIEIGWTHTPYYFLDPKGIKSESSLATENLEWVTQEHIDKYHEFARHVSKGAWLQTNKYILCALEGSNSALFPKFKTNQQFIDYVKAKHPDKKIVFTLHPTGQDKPSDLHVSKNDIITMGEKKFYEWAQDAELVYGMDSKALLESIAMGVPTIGLGDLFVNHQEEQENLMAAYVDRLISFYDDDLDDQLAKVGIHFY